jgi:nucleoside-diphosphate-sugar epimerase
LGVTCFRADLANAVACAPAFVGQDAVIHTAAKAGVWGKKEEFVASNVTATQNVISSCLEEGVTRLVFTSSPSVTFDGSDVLKGSRNLPYPKEFLAFYPETKAIAEQMVLAANSAKLRVTSLRPHLIWGPRDPHLIPRLVDAARAGRLKIVGSGQNQVDLTYVDNAAVAHLQALDALARDNGPAGKAYFVSDDQPVVLWDWINGLLKELGIAPITGHVSPKTAYLVGGILESLHRLMGLSGEPRMTRFVAQQLATSHWYDMEPARQDFGYSPLVDPSVGFERLLEHLRTN